MNHTFIRSAVALTAAAAALALPGSAQAGALVASAGDCAEQSLSQPFLPWADPAQYVLAPGGSAESSSGWASLSGASLAQGNEPWNVRDAQDHKSLSLPADASATTGTICVGIEHPTLRFFARGGGAMDHLSVEVLFEDAGGEVHDLAIGTVAAGSWSPTAVFPVVANLLPLLPGEHTPVAFRFTSHGTGTFQIDDVYVDPYGRY